MVGKGKAIVALNIFYWQTDFLQQTFMWDQIESPRAERGLYLNISTHTKYTNLTTISIIKLRTCQLF